MSRVIRIRVEVEVEDENGEITVHEAEGVPRPGDTVASIIPHYREQFSRSRGAIVASEIVEVGIRLNATLTAIPGVGIFRVQYPGVEVLQVEEKRGLADQLTSRSTDLGMPITERSGEAS